MSGRDYVYRMTGLSARRQVFDGLAQVEAAVQRIKRGWSERAAGVEFRPVEHEGGFVVRCYTDGVFTGWITSDALLASQEARERDSEVTKQDLIRLQKLVPGGDFDYRVPEGPDWSSTPIPSCDDLGPSDTLWDRTQALKHQPMTLQSYLGG